MPSWRRPSTRPGTSLRRAQGDRKSHTTLFRSGVTRLAYSDADRDGGEYVLGLMRDAKLAPTIDAAGDIIAPRPGRSEEPHDALPIWGDAPGVQRRRSGWARVRSRVDA